MIDQGEKFGGRPVSVKLNYFLRNFMFKAGAIDIGFQGNTFTWCNRRGGKANIRERLDRELVSIDWRTSFE